MQIQILRRKCDHCGRKEDFNMHGLTPMEEAGLASWVNLSKEHTLETGNPPQVFMKHACCSTCASEIIRNGLLEIPTGKIPAAN